MSVVLTGLSLAACGVPRLYAPPVPANAVRQDGEILLAPKVATIVDEVACELGRAKMQRVGLSDPYIVTVLLTLQVEDNLDLTPSFSFIHPFDTGSHGITTTASGDLGGDRKRTFTATYYLDSTKLGVDDRLEVDTAPDAGAKSDAATPRDAKACAAKLGQKKLFTLTGDLGLAAIVRDGEGALAHQTDLLHTPKDKDDKSVPTFGSTVQFIVTKSVSALGPVWSITHFKGPGGNNGLLSGKRVSTDSVQITFARQYVFPTAEQRAANTDLHVKKANEAAASQRARDVASTGKATLRTIAANRAAAVTRSLAKYRPTAKQAKAEIGALDRQRTQVEADIARAESDSNVAQHEVEQAQDRVSAADEAAKTDSTGTGAASATQAGQALLNTMVLQNLNIAPR